MTMKNLFLHTALLLAVREGHEASIKALIDAGADVNQVSTGDQTSPMLMAAINGQYDALLMLLSAGADPNIASDAGATPLYGVINKEWAPTSRTPQPAYQGRTPRGQDHLLRWSKIVKTGHVAIAVESATLAHEWRRHIPFCGQIVEGQLFVTLDSPCCDQGPGAEVEQ